MAEVTITDNCEEFKEEMERKITKALEEIGMYAEDAAKINMEKAPRRVDTGRLRNSITYAHREKSGFSYQYSDDDGTPYSEEVGQVDQEDKAVYVGTNVEYAEEIHEGRAKPPLEPNRFLANAVQQNLDTYKRMIEEIMKE